MSEKAISRLEQLTNIVHKLLKQISETEFAEKSQPNKWSKKEILGPY